MPKISICLPNLNNRPYLEERLQSIYDQTLEDWELVIVDNYSDDGAWELFQEHAAQDSRIRVSQAPKEGMYANWNNTLRLATGDYLYVATSDDTMYPRCLEAAVTGLERHPGLEVTLFGIDVIDAKGQKLEYWHSSWKRPPAYTWGNALKREGELAGRKEFLAQIFACGAYQSITGMLFSKKAFQEVGAFPVGFGSAGDTYWVMELMRQFDFLWIPESLATWRLHDQQGSRQKSVDQANKPSERDQAVNAALQNAIDHGFLSEAQQKMLIELRRENSLKKTVFPSVCEKVWNRVLLTNLTAKKRSQWVHKLMEIDKGRSI